MTLALVCELLTPLKAKNASNVPSFIFVLYVLSIDMPTLVLKRFFVIFSERTLFKTFRH